MNRRNDIRRLPPYANRPGAADPAEIYSQWDIVDYEYQREVFKMEREILQREQNTTPCPSGDTSIEELPTLYPQPKP